MPVKQILDRKNQTIPVKIWTDDIDYQSIEQLNKIATLPFLHKHIAVMPDVHLGKGSTVGAVIATKKAIIPATVGVDIGCGMCAVQLSLTTNDLPHNLKKIREEIEKKIPLGAGGAYQATNKLCSKNLTLGYESVFDKIGFGPTEFKRAITQLGTLGSGNHFIEICEDQNKSLWVVLHSGSRGIGNIIAQDYISKAKLEMEKFSIHLPDKDLAYLQEGSLYFDDYIKAVTWCQVYAKENRDKMMEIILDVLIENLPRFKIINKAINIHHNYISYENHFGEDVYITRKGATKAGKGEYGIIPGSMGDKTYIVQGKGNSESFCSCSHGAGRKFSRTEAKKRFSKEDLELQTKGIECRKDDKIIDEIPSAYKNIEDVMENQNDLIDICFTLKQLVNVKG